MKGEVKLRKLENTTVVVTVSRELKVRMFIAVLLIKVASRIMGCGVEVKDG